MNGMGDNGDGQSLQRSDAGNGENVSGGDEAKGEQTTVPEISGNGEPRESISEKEAEAQPERDVIKEVEIDGYVKMSLEDNLLAFNAMRLKRLYPKSFKEVCDFMAVRSQFPVDDQTTIGVFIFSPRSVLYEFFDRKKIFINIHGNDEYWKWSYEPNDSSIPFKSRVYAEFDGFTAAFVKLENQL